jgi:hypothetical protein
MYSIQEQFKTDALAQMNGRVHDAELIAGNILDLSREIGVLNVRTTKASAEQVAGAVRKLLGASNPGEFFQIAASVMQPDMQLWTSYIEQLRSIAGKAGLPLTAPLAPLASSAAAPAPQAAPGVTWPKFSVPAPQPVVPAAPAGEAPAVTEEAQREAVLAQAPEAPPPAAVPVIAALPESSQEAAQGAAETTPVAPPETVDAITEVAETMTGANKTPPAVMAASALPPVAPVVPEITVVRKTVTAEPARKPLAPPSTRKAAPPARSASNRSRKG